MSAFIKKLLAALGSCALLAVLVLCLGADASASGRECEEYGSISIVTRSDGGSTQKLLDADYETRCLFTGGERVQVSCPENIYGLYVIWDTVPGSWTLTIDDTSQLQCGADGFIHEYISLDGVRELTITIPDKGVNLCDIYLFGAGELPHWVQTWQPQYEQADILMVATHSDDEALFFGGLLPVYAQEYGYKVQMAYLTNHWQERLRPHELLCGLWTAGITAYPEISEFKDWPAYNGRYSNAQFEEYEVWLLRRFKPTVVVTQDLAGEYGHPTHIQGSVAMLSAVPAAADAAQYPDSAQQFGTWQVSKYYIHMYAENQLVMDWHIPLRCFDGQTGLTVAKASYGCHYSQHHLVFQVLEEGSGDCRLFGLYSSTVGEDTELDIMQHTGIDPQNGLFADMDGINDEAEGSYGI